MPPNLATRSREGRVDTAQPAPPVLKGRERPPSVIMGGESPRFRRGCQPGGPYRRMADFRFTGPR
jgi:hypothetical protein